MDSHQSLLVSSSWRAPLGQPSHHQWQHPQPAPRQRQPWSLPATSYSLQYPAYSAPSAHYDHEYQPAILPENSYHSSPSSSSSQTDSPRFPDASNWEGELYRFEPDQAHDAAEDIPQLPNTVPLSPSPPSRIQSPRIKEEDVPIDGFIFEGPKSHILPSHAFVPMAEVPLRATQATKAQRQFMGVFRLDPFAINNPSLQSQSGERDTDYSGEKIGPLKQPGREFQWQLEFFDGLKPEPAEASTVPSLTEDRSASPEISLSLPGTEEDDRMQHTGWDSPPSTSLYSSYTHEPTPYVPTPVQGLNWLRLQAGSSAEGSAYSDSPPLRSLNTPPYLSSSRELRMPDVSKSGFSRLAPYSNSQSLRLPPPTPSTRYISMPQIQSSDSYSDEPDSGWFNKSIPLSTSYYAVQKDVSNDSLSSNASLPLVPAMGSLANATRYRQPLSGSLGYTAYSSSLSNVAAERMRYSES